MKSQTMSFKKACVLGLAWALPLVQITAARAQMATDTDSDADTITIQSNSQAQRAATVLGQEVLQLCKIGKEIEEKAVQKGEAAELPDVMAFQKHLEKVAYETAHLPSANYQGAMSYLLASYYRAPECRYGIDALVKAMDNYVEVPKTLNMDTLYNRQMLEKTFDWGGNIFMGAMILQMFAHADPKATVTPLSQAKGLGNLMSIFFAKVSAVGLGIIEAPQNAGRLFARLTSSLRITDPKVIAQATQKAEALTVKELAALESGGVAAEQLPQAGRLSAWARARVLSQEARKAVLEGGKNWLSKRASAARLGMEKFREAPFTHTKNGMIKGGKAAWRAGGALLGNVAITSATALVVYGGYRSLGYGEIEAPKEVPSEILFKIQTQAVLDLETQILEVNADVSKLSQELAGRYFASPEMETTAALRQELTALLQRHRVTQVRWNHFSEKNSLFLHQLEEQKALGLEEEGATSLNQTAGVLGTSSDLLAKADESLKYFESEAAKKPKKKTR